MPPPTDGQWWCEAFATDEAVETMRRMVVPNHSRRLSWQIRQKEPLLKSFLLTVAQYWNDQADDEVHVKVIASARDVPDWPHDCGDDQTRAEVASRLTSNRDRCSWCSSFVPYLDWGYGELVPAFEAWCHERGNQNYSWENHRPIAILRDGDVEWVGQLVRPWLDMPRENPTPVALTETEAELLGSDVPYAVLADYWLDRGDVRGDYFALVTQETVTEELRERAYAIWVEHHRSWLGTIGPFVTRSGVKFGAEFLRDLELYVTPEFRDAFDPNDPVLLAVRSLRFLPGSVSRVGDGLRNVLSLSGIGDEGLLELSEVTGGFDLEELEVNPEDPASLTLLDVEKFPKLKKLRVIGRAAHTSLWQHLKDINGFERLDVLEVAAGMDGAITHWVNHWSRFASSVPVCVRQLDPDSQRAAGWAITIHDEHVVLERHGFFSGATRGEIEALARAVEGREIVIRPGSHWSPPADLVKSLSKA